jgi:hypothetical protein
LAEVLLGVGVELGWVLGYLLAELLFLDLPDVELLITVRENINIIWDDQSLLRWSTLAHSSERGDVLLCEIRCVSIVPHLESVLEGFVTALGVCFTFALLPRLSSSVLVLDSQRVRSSAVTGGLQRSVGELSSASSSKGSGTSGQGHV